MANLKDIGYGIGKYLVASDASSFPDIGTNRKNLDLLNFKVTVNNAYSLYNFKDGMIDAYQDATGVDTGASTNDNRNAADKYYSGSVDTAGSEEFSMTAADQTWTVSAGAAAESPVFIKCFAASGSGPNGGFSTGYLAVTEGTQYTVVVGQKYSNPGGTTGHKPAGYGGGGQGWGWDSGGGLSGVFTGTDAFSPTSTTVQARAIIIAGGGASYGGAGTQPGISPKPGSGGGAEGTDGTRLIVHTPNYATSGVRGTQSAAGGGGPSGSVMMGGSGSPSDGQEQGAGGGGYYAGGGGYGYQGNGGGGSGYVGNQNSLTSGLTYVGASTEKLADSDYVDQAQGSVFMSWGTQSYNNMTLISNAQTAQAAPTEGRIMLYEETSVGTNTLDTDLKAYVSRDGGTTYTQTPLVDDGYIEPKGGIDQYTKLMLHCDGANAGTTFTDSSSQHSGQTAHTVSAFGNAQTSTTQKKFGTAAYSATVAGAGYLTIPASDDWIFGAGDFTIDFWLYASALDIAYPNILNMNPSRWAVSWWDDTTTKPNELVTSLGGNNYGTTWLPVVDTWYHVAITRASGTLRHFIDGTQVGSDTTATDNVSTSDTLYVGSNQSPGDYWDGYMDELRISKGIARWTANFTPPGRPYSPGTMASDQRILSGSVDISGQPSGTNMKYKVETLNQSASKVCRLYGASLLWA